MIRLVFTYNHEVLLFDINNKVIYYRDRKWPNGVQFIPKDVELVKKILFSRNKISNQLIQWIHEANTGKNLEEWQACVDDEAVADIVKRDAKLKGCVLRKQFSEAELRDPSNMFSAELNKIPVDLPEQAPEAIEQQSPESIEEK